MRVSFDTSEEGLNTKGQHSGSQDPWMLAWKAKCTRLYFKGSFTDGPLDVLLQEIKFRQFECPFLLFRQISSVGAHQGEEKKKTKWKTSFGDHFTMLCGSFFSEMQMIQHVNLYI